MHQRNHSEIDGKSFLSESTISLICDIKITKDEKDKRNLKNQASKNNTQEWDIPKAELNELTKIMSDGEIAIEHNVVTSTVWKRRKKLGISSFTEKTNLKKNRKDGSTLRAGTGTPHCTTENQNNDYFNSIDTESKAYFFGLLLAEGNVVDNKKSGCSVGLSLSGEDDKKIVYRFREELKANQDVLISNRPGKKIAHVCRIYSRELVEKLVDLGVTVNTEEHIIRDPDIIPESLRRHVLRGIVDGDGHIGCKKHSFSISSCSQNLLKTVALWFKSKFEFASDQIKSRSLKSGKTFWSLTPGGGDPLKLLTWLYKDSTIAIPRKINEYQKWKAKNCLYSQDKSEME